MKMRMSRRGVLASGIAGAAAIPLPARADGLTSRIEEIRKAHDAPGLAVAVARHGQTIALAVAGRASIGLDVPVTSRTLFHLGSVGKHITAVAALRLVEAGKLALDAPVRRYASRLPPALADRPFHTLLTHTSGFPDYSAAVEWDRPFDRDTFYRLIAAYPPEFAAGAAWNYSNAAYVLIGYVIEDLAGKDYARLVAEDLFAPAGVRDGRVDDAALPIPRRAEPYEWREGRHFHAPRMSTTVSSVAAGGILMPMSDVARWTGALHGGALLSHDVLATMMRPVRLTTGREIPYGFGWMLDQMPGGEPIHYHGGSVPGFRTVHLHFPRQGLSVMAATNGDTLAATIAGWEAAERYAPGATPLSLPPLVDTAPELTRQVRAIATGGALDPAAFAPELRLHLDAGRDHVVPRFTPAQAAVLRDVALVQNERARDGTRRRRYRALFPGYVRHLTVHYLDDRRIVFMRIQ